MVPSAILLEREGRSAVLDYTIGLVCNRHKGGSFSLTLTESSDLGDLHHTVAKRLRSPRAFIDALMSLMDWTELEIDFDVILNEICAPLRDLDAAFADAIVEHIEADREGRPVRTGKLRA
jgi:hypothetical protein